MRLATWLVALVFVGHSARWFMAANNVTFWKACYVVGVLAGLYTFRLMIAYGRGTLTTDEDKEWRS